MTEMTQVKIVNEALAAIHGVNPGDIVNVECKNGVPLNREWRNRFRDMNIDHCIQVVEKKTNRGDK